MSYYMQGDYYRGKGRGDYYRGHGRGDPFWGALWTGIKAVGGALLGAARPQTVTPSPTPGAAGAYAMSQLPARIPVIGQGGFTPMERPLMSMPRAERQQLLQRHLRVDPNTGAVVSARRRMNPANAKALRRSIRRVVGFGRLAARSKRAVGKAATALGCFHRRSTRAFPKRRAS